LLISAFCLPFSPFSSCFFPDSFFTAVSGCSPYESWVYSGFNFVLGLPIIFYGILDRDLSAEFVQKHPQVSDVTDPEKNHSFLLLHFKCDVCCLVLTSFPFLFSLPSICCCLQTYSTGRTNVLLTMVSILQWIGNAMMYAVVVCLMSYNVLFPTFYNLDLYRAGEFRKYMMLFWHVFRLSLLWLVPPIFLS